MRRRSPFRTACAGLLAVAPLLASAATAPPPKAVVTAGYADLTPFSKRIQFQCKGTYGFDTFTVPAGQRLVIDYIAADVAIYQSGSALLYVNTTVNGEFSQISLPLTMQGPTDGSIYYRFLAHERLALYADAGTQVSAEVENSVGFCYGGVQFSGHLVPVN
jgi:hypothetical protein